MSTAMSAEEHDEPLGIYQHCIEDVERAKQWGWQLFGQAIAAQFGFVARMIAAVYVRKPTEQAGVANDQKSVTQQVEHARA